MSIIEKDPDLMMGAGIECPVGVSRGYAEIIDHCPANPDMFMEIESLGTIKYKSKGTTSFDSGAKFSISSLGSTDITAAVVNVNSEGLAIESKSVSVSGDNLSASLKLIAIDSESLLIDSKIFKIDGDEIGVSASEMTLDSDEFKISGKNLSIDGEAIVIDGDAVEIKSEEGVTIHDPVFVIAGVTYSASQIAEAIKKV